MDVSADLSIREFLDLGDASRASQIAVDDGGALVHVDDVPRGLACNCRCPSPDCGGRLEARQGDIRIHHFAHSDERPVTCRFPAETLLHLFAADLIGDEGVLLLPALGATAGRAIYEHLPARSLTYDACSAAPTPGLGRPVMSFSSAGGKLLVELVTARPFDAERIPRLEATGLDVLEIDLTGLLDEPAASLDHLIFHEAPRSWLVHGQMTACRKRAEELDGERRALVPAIVETPMVYDRERLEYRPRTILDMIDAAREHARDTPIAEHDEPVTNLKPGLLIDFPPSATFSCHHKVWQVEVLRALAASPTALDPVELANTHAIAALTPKTFAGFDATLHLTMGFLGEERLIPSGLIGQFLAKAVSSRAVRTMGLSGGVTAFGLGETLQKIVPEIKVDAPSPTLRREREREPSMQMGFDL